MILADSSVWIDHLRSDNPEFRRLLDQEQIAMHPYVALELALGSLKDRRDTLAELDRIDAVSVASVREVRSLIEAQSLYSRGIGFVDAHLIASCLITGGTRLWTRDTRLRAVAHSLSLDAVIP